MLQRIGQCVLTYVLIHCAAWIVVALVVPWEDSFAQIARLGLGFLAFTGIPTLLLAIGTGLAHTKMDVVQFRLALTLPMLVFTFPLLGMSTAEPFVLQVAAQLLFVTWLMPAPLVPENWVGNTGES
ncbi:hypothetical protein ACFV98_02675 [Streptomyces violascens]|uniref:hypothetical protein n=1 Tax=Streptomyces violascens TaxID=67381 RepID=UPI003646A933